MLIPLILVIVLLYFITSRDNSCNCQDNSNLFKCHKCGFDLKDDYIYCPKCKEKLKRKCEKCGKMIDVTWRRCPFCD